MLRRPATENGRSAQFLQCAPVPVSKPREGERRHQTQRRGHPFEGKFDLPGDPTPPAVVPDPIGRR